MNYVSTNFDTDSDGYLSDEEIAAVTRIDVYGRGTSADGGITSLVGLERFTELTYLNCVYNAGLTEIDVSQNTALTTLYCDGTSITSLDISHNSDLTDLSCWAALDLSSLDVSQNTVLTDLQCANTGITSLDVSKILL